MSAQQPQPEQPCTKRRKKRSTSVSLGKQMRDYRWELLRLSSAVLSCPWCKVLVTPRFFEKHCSSEHSFDINTQCVWCDGRYAWPSRKKCLHGSHLISCFRNFAYTRGLLLKDPPTAPAESQQTPCCPAAPLNFVVPTTSRSEGHETKHVSMQCLPPPVLPMPPSPPPSVLPSLQPSHPVSVTVTLPPAEEDDEYYCCDVPPENESDEQRHREEEEEEEDPEKASLRRSVASLTAAWHEWTTLRNKMNADLEMLSGRLCSQRADRTRMEYETFQLRNRLLATEAQLGEERALVQALHHREDRDQARLQELANKIDVSETERRRLEVDAARKQAKIEELYEKVLGMTEMENRRLTEEVTVSIDQDGGNPSNGRTGGQDGSSNPNDGGSLVVDMGVPESCCGMMHAKQME